MQCTRLGGSAPVARTVSGGEQRRPRRGRGETRRVRGCGDRRARHRRVENQGREFDARAFEPWGTSLGGGSWRARPQRPRPAGPRRRGAHVNPSGRLTVIWYHDNYTVTSAWAVAP